MHTPKSLQRVVAEVGAVNCVLGEVQRLVSWRSDEERPDNPRLGLIQLNQLVEILTGCVLVFSELEKHIDDLVGAESGSRPRIIWERISWTRKEDQIGKSMDDLNGYKMSLNLMLTIIQCTNQAEAVGCMKHLCSVMVDILESNRIISAQLRTVMARQDSPDQPDDAASVRTGRTAISTRSVPVAIPRPVERVLRKSKVYKYNRIWNMSKSSLGSLSTASTGRTSISTASLSEVQNISAIALPLQPQDLWNAEHYLEGGNTPSTAVSTDASPGFFAVLDQQRNDGSLGAAQAGGRQLNPALAAFSNAIVLPAFYGNFGKIGPMLVKGFLKVMPYRQLLLLTWLPVNALANQLKSGHEERAKRMIRACIGIGEWFLETQKDPKIVRGMADQFTSEGMDLLDRGEVEETKYYYLASVEVLLRMVETENKLAAGLLVDIYVRGVESALARPYVAQISAMVEDTFQKINLSTTVWGWMESRITAIAALLSVQQAVKLRKVQVLDCMMDALSVVHKRLSLSTHPHVWFTMVLGWEGQPWLLEELVATATVLLKYEREGVKPFAGLVIDSLEWILKVANSANRLSEVLTLIGKFTSGLSDGPSSGLIVPDGEQEVTGVGEGSNPANDQSRVREPEVGMALGKVLAALSRKHLDDEKDVGEA